MGKTEPWAEGVFRAIQDAGLDRTSPQQRADLKRLLDQAEAEIVSRPFATEGCVGALALIDRYGGIDGAHHKQWVLDQIVRKITGPLYEEWVATRRAEGYEWDVGIAP